MGTQVMVQRSPKASALGQMSKLQLAALLQPIVGVTCLALALYFELDTLAQCFSWSLLVRVIGIALGITMITVSELKLVELSSAVTCGVLINVHHIPMVLAGVLLFHDKLKLKSLYGFASCILGGCLYAYARYDDEQELQKKKASEKLVKSSNGNSEQHALE